MDTGFIGARPQLAETRPLSQEAVDGFASLTRLVMAGGERGALDAEGLGGFRLNAPARETAVLWVDGTRREARLGRFGDADLAIVPEDGVLFEGGDAHLVSWNPPLAAATGAASDGKLLAPMPGRIVSVAAKAGQVLKKGDPVVTLEAMKMEHAMVAPFDAVVAELSAAVGDQVSEGAVLARLETAEG